MSNEGNNKKRNPVSPARTIFGIFMILVYIGILRLGNRPLGMASLGSRNTPYSVRDMARIPTIFRTRPKYWRLRIKRLYHNEHNRK